MCLNYEFRIKIEYSLLKLNIFKIIIKKFASKQGFYYLCIIKQRKSVCYHNVR
jgi:hypothetical protein